MRKFSLPKISLPLMVPATALAIGLGTLSAQAQTEAPLYNPIPLPANNEVSDSLTDKDIPTGLGGFARDYLVSFKEGEQVVMDLTSEEFDTIITLIAPDGATVAENDDAPDGSTNSMLFARITRPGNYIVRVSPYAGQGVGRFNLKVTRLRPVD
ncbi:MAG: PPC domain-containing protein [Synechococcales cyanobacterium C42_A2020_086]|jgi:hypothetical protein|nr:PPC domain-containing protein [Synechococcales cyanobacterium M58_A2018_015]MBF2074203.1 PPC domain-containing protein [Synechococcales cyanobacterium C42_A2020_086]